MSSAASFDNPTQAYTQGMTGAETMQQRATPAAAFARAREMLIAGEKLDMARLAIDIEVSRATLYRWTGDRERLLADVVWAEVGGMIEYFDRNTNGRGATRLTTAAGDYLDALAGSDALRAFLTNEGASGLRLVTAHDGGVHPRFVDAITAIIIRETKSGYHPPDDPALLADGIVALAERWLYHNGDPTMNPAPAMARRVIGLLLREPCDAERSGRTHSAGGRQKLSRDTEETAAVRD